jgi:hypothetical protein
VCPTYKAEIVTTLWLDDLKKSFYSKGHPVDVLDTSIAKQARLTLIERFIAFNKPSVLKRIRNLFWKAAIFDSILKSDLHKHEARDVNIRKILSKNDVEPSPLMFLSSDKHTRPHKIAESKYVLDNQSAF